MADTGIMKQIADKIKDSSNILVTVNTNPSVDELSAALGITLFINKLNKHATAVFSGAVPPAIEFLNPEKTFENTVDSLRDFIIALDKEKADHLRYKVVDDMVKIFITPYRTTISEKDLDFSQGDYNVEMVLAIGVKTEADLDRALESHGRIMHDAAVATVSLGEPTKLGGIEWVDGQASSYSEMLVGLVDELKNDKAALDEQIATAFLTGIVAATDRFSNSSTSSRVMTIAAQLMAAGANQQLIATQLQKEQAISPEPVTHDAPTSEAKTEEPKGGEAVGALSISHEPEGDVDEVTKQVNEARGAEALDTAQQELAQTKPMDAPAPVDAGDAAEQKLAEQLAAAAPAAGAPMSGPISEIDEHAQPIALRGAVSMDKWRGHGDDEAADAPSLGGTLNATAEQAADDARKVQDDDRNRTILTHGGGAYVTSEPSFQAPLNATASGVNSEPEVKDILAEGSREDMTTHIDAIQPPAPVEHAPTLADIDAQARAHEEAMGAVNQALTNPTAADGLPPLPPMPDFSTLPPLPPDLAPPVAPSSLIVDTPVPAPTGNANDPAQFRIPGQ
ncbi:MAG: hypothetical protein ABIM96_01465 [Candidatus Saccharimonas sp.]